MTALISQVLFYAVVLVAIIVAFPLAWIWSVNTLFGLSIPFTLKTWGAAALIGSGLFARANYKVT